VAGCELARALQRAPAHLKNKINNMQTIKKRDWEKEWKKVADTMTRTGVNPYQVRLIERGIELGERAMDELVTINNDYRNGM